MSSAAVVIGALMEGRLCLHDKSNGVHKEEAALFFFANLVRMCESMAYLSHNDVPAQETRGNEFIK